MARKSQRPASGNTILVVDDQEEVLLSVRSLLEREGHRVLTAEGGAQALHVLKRNDVHLLLVDYFMPVMTGEDLIREIRRFDPWVQIILQTGYAGEKPASRMMKELDIQGYHDKTDGPEKLLLWVDVGLKAHRLIQTLRERERLHSELVANVSHEFRTPLHIIGGYTELLLAGEFGALPADAQHPLQQVSAATANLAELVNDLLRYGKLEAGVADTSLQQVAVADLCAEIERLGNLLLDERDVELEIDRADAPECLQTDRTKLRTILRNLVTNAAKFTACGTIAVRVAEERERVIFSVRDTGVGIAPQDQELIFEPFRQLDGSTTRRHRGIGLGLALSRKLARILGGELSVQSAIGVGSTFTLALPLPVGTRADAAAPSLSPWPAPAARRAAVSAA
jgi:signal transduction histidine kinase